MADALQREMSKLRLTQLVRRGHDPLEVAVPVDAALRRTAAHGLPRGPPKRLLSPTQQLAVLEVEFDLGEHARHRSPAGTPGPGGLGVRAPGGHRSSPPATLPSQMTPANSGVMTNQPENRSPFGKPISDVQHASPNLVTQVHSPRTGKAPELPTLEGNQGEAESNRQTNTTRRAAFKQTKQLTQTYSRDDQL